MTPAVAQTTARARRLARLRRLLHEQGLGAALLIRPEHLRYFAGTNGGGMPAALVVTRDTAVLIAAAGLAPAETLKLLASSSVPTEATTPADSSIARSSSSRRSPRPRDVSACAAAWAWRPPT